MRLAILETGTPPDALIARFRRYPAMFARLLGRGFDYDNYDVAAGDLPGDASDHDAYLITGSPAAVYEPEPWIGELIASTRAMRR